MANILQERKPATSQRLTMPFLAAGLFGLACASLLGHTWERPATPPALNLKAAISDFDTGHLKAATAAFSTLANTGNSQAAFWYGHALDRGLGTQVDTKAAIAQYEKAWAGGVIPAGTRLGELYLDGNAVPPSFAKGRTYLTDAAQRGDARAALDLGDAMQKGIGGPVDPVGAYAWLEVAALRGNAQAQGERNHVLTTLTPAQQVEASRQATADLPVVVAKKVAAPAKA